MIDEELIAALRGEASIRHNYSSSIKPVEQYLEWTAADRIATLTEALEFFADDANWRMNGPLDPNSGNFIGRIHARAALQTEGKP